MKDLPESPESVARRLEVRPQRVVVAGEFGADRFGLHIAETLDAMGCTVTRHEMRRPPTGGSSLRHRVHRARELVDQTVFQRLPLVRRRRLEVLAANVERAGAEVVLFTYDYLLPAEVEYIKARSGAQVALWYPDHIANMGRMACLAAPFDALFFKDPYMVHALRDLAAGAVYYLPEAFNPARHRLPDGPIDRSSYVCDVTTAGTLHVARYAVFRQLTDLDVRIWGDPPPPWLDAGAVGRMHQGRYVADEEKAVAFTSACVVLNTLYPAEVWGLNARAFEAAGVGAFQMVDWRPGLAQLFDDGKEVVSFRGTTDLRDRLAHYLHRPDERAAIAAAGQARARLDHTYARRLATLLHTLAGHHKGYPAPHVECVGSPGCAD